MQSGVLLLDQMFAGKLEGYDAVDIRVLLDRAMHAALRRSIAFNAPHEGLPSNPFQCICCRVIDINGVPLVFRTLQHEGHPLRLPAQLPHSRVLILRVDTLSTRLLHFRACACHKQTAMLCQLWRSMVNHGLCCLPLLNPLQRHARADTTLALIDARGAAIVSQAS